MNKKDYRIELYTIDTPSGTEFYAHYPSIKGISGGGKTAAEAIAVLEDGIEEHIEFWLDQGYPIPKSDIIEETYKGKIALRISGPLHRSVVEESKRQGISANTLIGNVLSEYLGERKVFREMQGLKSYLVEILDNQREHNNSMSIFCETMSKEFIKRVGKDKYQTESVYTSYHGKNKIESGWWQ